VSIAGASSASGHGAVRFAARAAAAAASRVGRGCCTLSTPLSNCRNEACLDESCWRSGGMSQQSSPGRSGGGSAIARAASATSVVNAATRIFR